MLMEEPSAYGFQVPRTVLPFLSLASTVRARGLSPLSTYEAPVQWLREFKATIALCCVKSNLLPLPS